MFYSKITTNNGKEIIPFRKASFTFEDAWYSLNQLISEQNNIIEAVVLEDDKVIASARLIK